MTEEKTPQRGERASHLRWVKIGDLVAHPKVQRVFRLARAQKIAANLDFEKFGYPTVSIRGGVHYVIDGQHRVAALKLFGFTGDDTVQCQCHTDLTDEREHDLFVGINEQRAVDAFSNFKNSVGAGYPRETTINNVVRHLGLHVGQRGQRGTEGAISAVKTLGSVYDRIGDVGLAKTLRIVRDAYGSAGLEAPVIDGVSLCVQRYDGTLHEDTAVSTLAGAVGGLNGLLNQAEKTRAMMGQPKAECVAAAVVDTYNRACGGKRNRLAPWWKD